MSKSPAGRPNLEVFAETVEEIAKIDPKFLLVTSDSRGSGKVDSFANRMPERMVEVGIAEQNLVGVAAGLAAGGRNVVAVSPASFLVTRSLEQIKNDVCYSDRHVILIGISAGVSYGALGSTHHSLHDFAALRAIHNVTIVAPADNWETREALRSALSVETESPRSELKGMLRRPFYIRFGKQAVPDLPHRKSFAIGKGRVVRDGSHAAIIATGETVWRAFFAAKLLESRGISATVVSMHTLKPLDTELVIEIARRVPAVVTVEEHSEHGGLGDACARTLLEAGVTPKFRGIAIPDEYTVTGSQEEILGHYDISVSGIAEATSRLLAEA